MPRPSEYSALMRALAENGVLLEQDKTLTSIATMIAGGPLSASWWGHPRAKVIFDCLSRLADDPDVLQTKLVSRKVTFVHRRLWPAVLAIALEHEPWQLAGLSQEARKLLEEIESKKELMASGKIALELELRLLVHGEQVHTESGAHRLRLESWSAWSSRMAFISELSPAEGRVQLEKAVSAIGGTGHELPWQAWQPRHVS